MLPLKNTCYAHFCSMQRHFNVIAALHVKLISVTIHFIFSECSAELHIIGSVYLSSAQSHGTIYGANTPQSIGSFKQSLKPTISLLLTPSLFITTFLAFSTHTHTQTHMHMLHHNRDTEIPTCASL